MASLVTHGLRGYYPEPQTTKPQCSAEIYGNLPIHDREGMKNILEAMQKLGIALERSAITGHMEIDAEMIMKNSAHIADTVGSPGTIFIIPKPSRDSALQKFTVIVVNQLGDIFKETIRKSPERGWSYKAPDAFHLTYESLLKDLLINVRVVGDCMGIQFFTPNQRTQAITKLESSIPGTYICFAHEPTEEFKEAEHASPTKRNVLMWKTETGLQIAFFHYNSEERQWLNGGPQIATREEMDSTGGSVSPYEKELPISDSTLEGLIRKKITAVGLEPTPLSLDII